MKKEVIKSWHTIDRTVIPVTSELIGRLIIDITAQLTNQRPTKLNHTLGELIKEAYDQIEQK